MRGFGIEKNNRWVRFVSTLLILGIISVYGGTPVGAQANTTIGATVCSSSGSLVTVSSPPSDSVVTDPAVTLKGTVSQATQISVTIDDNFDSVIALNTGQSAFEAPIQLPTGTHTVKLTAIDSCQQNDGVSTVILTFTPPPSSASTGEQTATGINNGTNQSGGVTVGAGSEAIEPNKGGGILLPKPIADTFDGLFRWLNITPNDVAQQQAPRLSIWRAITIAVGGYMATIGVATAVVSLAASSPLFPSVKTNRFLYASRLFRVIGVLLVLAGLFL